VVSPLGQQPGQVLVPTAVFDLLGEHCGSPMPLLCSRLTAYRPLVPNSRAAEPAGARPNAHPGWREGPPRPWASGGPPAR
jgi:hypothetical protein